MAGARVYLVGLTGGIGSGKSTVARRLSERGAHVIDADQVARGVLDAGSPGLAAVVDRFGDDIVDGDGALIRQALADIIFNDPQARADLDAITHPRISARIAELVAGHAEAERGEYDPRVVVVDHPLLIETGQASGFPDVIVVLAEAETRIRRLVDQRGLREADARARLAAQATDEQRRDAATYLIRNDGSLADLEIRTDEIHRELVAKARRASTESGSTT